MNAIVKKSVAVGVFAAALALSPNVFASDRFPLPHEILGIPTPHELLGIPAPHEFILGPDRFSRYNPNNNYYYGSDHRYYGNDHHYNGQYYRSYDHRDWRYRHSYDQGRYWHRY